MRVGVLGAAFKPGSDDVRDSPALDVAQLLHRAEADVTVYDPEALDNARQACPELRFARSAVAAARDAQVVMLLTEWPELVSLRPAVLDAVVARRAIVDGRNVLDPAEWRAAGWQYRAPGVAPEPRPRPGSLAGMRARLVLAAAVVIALVAVGLAATRLLASPARPAPAASARAGRAAGLLPRRLRERRDGELPAHHRLRAGRRPRRRTWSATSAAGRSRSRPSFARQASAHGATTLVQIDPTYASVAGIAAGSYDGYLRSFADSVARRSATRWSSGSATR